MSSIRVASGEKSGWQTIDEAVVAPPSSDDYSFKPCFENGNSTSIYDENRKKH